MNKTGQQILDQAQEEFEKKFGKTVEGTDKNSRYGIISIPECSDWQCRLFNGGEGLSWRPPKNKVPNWFWRLMQYLCFGNRWVKDEVKKVT